MAEFAGGDVLEITYTHPTLGQGRLVCKAAEGGTMDRGGFGSNDDANSVTGSGEFIDQMNRKRWSYETPPVAWDMMGADELGKLQDLQESPLAADWTIEHISGAIYGGKGKPVGDLNADTNTALITVKLSGGGKLEKIN